MIDLTAKDKQLHMAGSALIALVLSAIALAVSDFTLGVCLLVLIGANLPGLAKEIHDGRTPGNYFDPVDLLANLIGSATVIAVVFIVCRVVIG